MFIQQFFQHFIGAATGFYRYLKKKNPTILWPTFSHLKNPDIVLVHYLNVPYPDDNKMLVTNSVTLWGDKKEWTKEELVSQLKPMCKYSQKLLN